MIDEIVCGDVLEVIKSISDGSIDLIVTDPPYFRVKDCWWDRQWNNTKNYIDWFESIVAQWKRVLKTSGSFYCFASAQMALQV